MENLNTAFLLMIVGMGTVFAILILIIYLGKFIIYLVNKYAPEEIIPVKRGASGPDPIPANILAAITNAVHVVTHNKGKIVKIEKQN